MERITVLLLPALLGIGLLRLFLAPVRLAVKLALHALAGLMGLAAINLFTPITGVLIPINMVTVLVSGILGLPGTTLLILLEL